MIPIADSLESKRLLLEVRKSHHADEIYELLCDEKLYVFIDRSSPSSLKLLKETYKRLESNSSPDEKEIWLGWIGREKWTKKPVGVFEITIIGEDAFVAYIVFSPYWGKGYALEASQAMIDFISKTYCLKKFVIEMDTRNRSSFKVAEKLGFDFVEVKNNAGTIKGFVSHEFKFQKILRN